MPVQVSGRQALRPESGKTNEEHYKQSYPYYGNMENQLNLSYLGGQKKCHFLGILNVNEDPIMIFSNFGSFPRL